MLEAPVEGPVRQSKPTLEADIWTFNLRSTKTNLDDSDSESDNNDATNPASGDSEETRLLKDLDLASREETVAYKPNPFSIAKINAASRPNRSSTPIVSRPTKPVSKKLQGRIIDSFNLKKKAKKASDPPAAAPTQGKKLPANVNATPNAAPRPSNLVVSSPKSPAPAPCIPLVDLSPVPTRISVERTLSSAVPDQGAGYDLPLAKRACRSPFLSALPPPKIIPRKFRPPAPISFSSPFKAPFREVSSTTNQYLGNRLSFSSPPRPAQSPLLSSIPGGNIVQSRYPAGKSIGTLQMQGLSAYHRPRTNTIHDPRLTPDAKSLDLSTDSNVSAQESRYMSTPSGSTRHVHPLPAIESAAVSTPYNPIASPAFRSEPGPVEVSLYHCDDPGGRAPSADSHSPAKNICRQHDLNLPPQLPPSSPILSPTPSPSPRRNRAPVPKLVSTKRPPKRENRDAYNYLRPDPDDEWSTLPARKKFKASDQSKSTIPGIKTTAPFRLPGTSTKAKVTGISATSERRVVTFLPPPLKSKDVEVLVEDTRPMTANSTRAVKHSRGSDSSPPIAAPKRRRIPENPYPSPANSRLTPDDVTMVVDQPSATYANSPSPSPLRPSTHRMPSPPTSDPLPEYDSDVPTASVTVDGVLQRYPRTKSLIRQRKQGISLWHLLELPSCGIVRSDYEQDLSMELPVVLWEKVEG